jgi:hypothetical protein
MNNINDTVGSLSGAGAIINGGNLTLSGNNGSLATFSGTFTGTNASRTLTKSGSGEQILNGTNDFTMCHFQCGGLRLNSNTALNWSKRPATIKRGKYCSC